jgi:hypothetical protein
MIFKLPSKLRERWIGSDERDSVLNKKWKFKVDMWCVHIIPTLERLR